MILFCSMLHAGSALGQSEATLRILVTSGADGSPIPGANAVLISPDPEIRKQRSFLYAGTTDSDGFLEFREVDPGRYILRVTFVGYRTYRDSLNLNENERIVERIILQEDVAELGELVVQGEREVTVGEAGLNRISDIEVARIPTPVSGGDLSSYLQTLPGVVTTGDRGGNIFVRGGTPFQNRVLVDNLTVIKPFHISSLFSAFPGDALQSVDFYAGGFGARYMGATSAIIDVDLKPGNFLSYEGSGSVGSHMASLALEGPIKSGSHSFLARGRMSLIEHTAPTLTGAEDPIRFYDGLGRYTYQGEDFFCNVTLLGTYDSGQIDPSRDIELSWNNTVAGGRCLTFNESFAQPVEVTVGYTGFQNFQGTSQFTQRKSALTQAYLKVDHAFEELGTNFNYGFGMGLARYETELANRFRQLDSFVTRTAYIEMHASTDLVFHERLTVQPGLGSQATTSTHPTIEPRLRVSFLPDNSGRHEISLAAGRYFQSLNAITDERDAGTVFAVVTPSDNEDPLQEAWHAIVSYRLLLGGFLEAKIEGYAKWHRNIAVSRWNPDAQIEIRTALANGKSYGAELRLEYDRSPFYAYLGYSWSKVEYEASSDDLGAWIEEPVFRYTPGHDRRHKLNSLASWEFGEFTASASWEYGTGYPYTRVYGFDLQVPVPDEHPLDRPGRNRTLFSEPYGGRLPPYHRLDFSVSRPFEISSGTTVEATLGMINAYNQENIFFFDSNKLLTVYQTSRFPFVSLRASFR